MKCPYCGSTLDRNLAHPGDDRRTMARHITFKHPATAADLLEPYMEMASNSLIRIGGAR